MVEITRLIVLDDLFAAPDAYRAAVLAQPFQSVQIGPACFHGIATAPDASFAETLHMRLGLSDATTTFCRLSPAGQVEPNYIHTDRDMGAWTAILYLQPHPPDGDGTTFWQDRQTGSRVSNTDGMLEAVTWRDQMRWEPWQTVEAKWNRAIVFPAAWFHSRAIFANYGASNESARLIQVMFGGPYVRRH